MVLYFVLHTVSISIRAGDQINETMYFRRMDTGVQRMTTRIAHHAVRGFKQAVENQFYLPVPKLPVEMAVMSVCSTHHYEGLPGLNAMTGPSYGSCWMNKR